MKRKIFIFVALTFALAIIGIHVAQPRAALTKSESKYSAPEYTLVYHKSANITEEERLSAENAANIGVRLLTEAYAVDLNGQEVAMAFIPHTGSRGELPASWRGSVWLSDETEEAWLLAFQIFSESGEIVSINKMYTNLNEQSVMAIDTSSNFKPVDGKSIIVLHGGIGGFGLDKYNEYPESYSIKIINFANELKEPNNEYVVFAKEFAVAKGLLPDAINGECVELDRIRIGAEEQDSYVVYVSVTASSGQQLILRFHSATKAFLGAETEIRNGNA